MNPLEIRILGVRIDNLNMDEAVLKVLNLVKGKKLHQIITANSLMLNDISTDQKLRDVFARASLVVADSVGVLWAAKTLGWSLKARVTGIDLIYQLCAECAKIGASIFLLGAKPGVAPKAAEKLKEEFPQLKITGTAHGYFDQPQEQEIITKLREIKPDILLVGLNIPFQEKWICENLSRLNVPVCVGVGGSFDVISGRLKRAPQIMQKMGLEWLWRVLVEPWRIKRIAHLPIFMLKIYRQKWLGKYS